MKQRKVFYVYLFSLVIIYILIYIPSYYVPFHSDDYLFYLRGISLEAHYKHYMTWEGRIIGDYIGALLLHFFSRPVYMAINSLVFLLILVNISLVPAVIFRKPLNNGHNIILLWIAFLLYWLCNPCLGQTSFWIIGSVIYMWPLMWAGYYIHYLIKLLQNYCHGTDITNFIDERQQVLQRNDSIRIRELFLLGLLGFLAGLSNEATGATVVFFTLMLGFLFRYADWAEKLRKKAEYFRKGKVVYLTGLASTLTGFLILLLAPGNYVRFHWIGFASWQNASLTDKILYHVYERFPWAISRFWFAFLLLAILLLVLINTLQILKLPEYKNLRTGCSIITILFLFISALSVIAENQIQYKRKLLFLIFQTYGLLTYVFLKIYHRLKCYVNTDCKTITYYGITVLFFIMAIFSVFIFIASPFMPERTLNTFNFFIVLTIIMLIAGMSGQLTNKRKSILFGIFFVLCIPYFLFSYARFTHAVMQTKEQAIIREEIIAAAKTQHFKQVEIPDWYFTKLAKDTDKFDLFRSDAMPAYYGIEQIVWNPAYFNYAILKTKRPVIENLQVTDATKLDFYYDDSFWLFDDDSFVIGFDRSPLLLTDKADCKILFKLYLKKDKSLYKEPIIVEKNVENFTKVGNRYFYAIKIHSDVKAQDVRHIEVALSVMEKGKMDKCVEN